MESIRHHQAESAALANQSNTFSLFDSDRIGETASVEDVSLLTPSFVTLDNGASQQELSDEPTTNMPPSLRLREKVIPAAIWERYRPDIEELYLHRNLSLAQVMEIMKNEHGFIATDKMYKKRFKDWAMRKNYTKEQKKKCITQLTQPGLRIDTDSPLTLNGDPVKLRRLDRLVQQNGKRFSLVTRPDRDAIREWRARHLDRNRTPAVQRIQFQHSPEAERLEQLLKCADTYFSWYRTQTQIKVNYHYTYDLGMTFSPMALARLLLSKQAARAFALMNRVCANFYTLLEKQPFQLLQLMTMEFSNPSWGQKQFWPVQQSVVKYFASLTKSTLGSTHPISTYTALLATVDHEQIRHLVRRFAELLTNFLQTAFGPQDAAHISVQQSMVVDLSKFGFSDLLNHNLMSRWDSIQPVRSIPTQEERLRHLTMILQTLIRADYVSTEKLLHQQFSWSNEATGRPNGDEGGAWACFFMGVLNHITRRYCESEKFYRLALEGRLQSGRLEKTSLIRNLEFLEDSLQRQGKQDDIAQLRDQYGYIWAELDEWRLDRGLDGDREMVQAMR